MFQVTPSPEVKVDGGPASSQSMNKSEASAVPDARVQVSATSATCETYSLRTGEQKRADLSKSSQDQKCHRYKMELQDFVRSSLGQAQTGRFRGPSGRTLFSDEGDFTFSEAPFEGILHQDLKEASPSEGFKGASPSEGRAEGT